MSRKRRPRDLQPMALDGWIMLRPGEAFAWDKETPMSPSIPFQRDLMRNLRGSVLGAAFDVDYRLTTLILAKEFGTLDRTLGGQAFVTRSEQLQRNDFGLERKIEKAKPAIRTALDHMWADALMQDLAEYRRLRHLMTHRPCWLESSWDPEVAGPSTPEAIPKGRTVGVRLLIADESFVWEVDDAQVQEWDRLIRRCLEGLDGARAKFLPSAPDSGADLQSQGGGSPRG
jgi:hypothetical protein